MALIAVSAGLERGEVVAVQAALLGFAGKAAAFAFGLHLLADGAERHHSAPSGIALMVATSCGYGRR